MTAHKKLDRAADEAQRDAEAKSEPMAVVEFWNPNRTYIVRTLVKAQHLVAKHPEAKIKLRVYPKAGTLDGVG